MWVMEVLQDEDLAVEIILELRIELLQIDRFDGDVTRAPLEREIHISKKFSPRRCLRVLMQVRQRRNSRKKKRLRAI